MSTDFDKEMHKDLDKVVVTTSNTDWVNPHDKLAEEVNEQFRATLVSREEVKNKVAESVDGLPVKDRDLIDGKVHVPTDLEDGSDSILDDKTDTDEPEVEVNTDTVESEVEVDDAESEVPEGTVREVLDWVDGDAEKAQKALDVENAKESPRKSLVSQLEDIVGA